MGVEPTANALSNLMWVHLRTRSSNALQSVGATTDNTRKISRYSVNPFRSRASFP